MMGKVDVGYFVFFVLGFAAAWAVMLFGAMPAGHRGGGSGDVSAMLAPHHQVGARDVPGLTLESVVRSHVESHLANFTQSAASKALMEQVESKWTSFLQGNAEEVSAEQLQKLPDPVDPDGGEDELDVGETSGGDDDDYADGDGGEEDDDDGTDEYGDDDDADEPQEEPRVLPAHCLENTYRSEPAKNGFDTNDPRHHMFVLHIPKAGGSTFAGFLRVLLARSPVRGWCQDYPKLGKCHCLGQHKSMRFPDFEPRTRKQARVIEGHFKYGFHQFLSRPHRAFYVTLLREPKSRYISQWVYSQKLHLMPRVGLLKFTKSAKPFCNWQTAMLAGGGEGWDSDGIWSGNSPYLPSLCPPYTTLKQTALAAAKRHLDSFAVAMVLERMAESLCVFAEVFQHEMGGHRVLCGRSYRPKNKTGKGGKLNQDKVNRVAKRNADHVAKVNELDTALYEAAWQKLEEQISGPYAVCRQASFTEDGVFTAPVCEC